MCVWLKKSTLHGNVKHAESLHEVELPILKYAKERGSNLGNNRLNRWERQWSGDDKWWARTCILVDYETEREEKWRGVHEHYCTGLRIKNMIVFEKIILKKLFFKFFCVYLLLEKLINKNYFSINKKHFPVKKN